MDKLTVVKSNRLIESAYSLSLLEQQIILYSIAHGRERDELLNGKVLTIRVSDFARQFKNKDKNIHANLKIAAQAFFNRRLRVSEHKAETNSIEVMEYRWLQAHGYNDGDGTISIQFTDEVLQHITRIDGKLQRYTEYAFLNVVGLKSPHTVRLYELLRKNYYTGKYLMDVDFIRESFDLGDKYPRTRDITKHVIERSLLEINEKSDIQATFESIRTGRAVTQYLFTIRFIEKLEPEEVKPDVKKQAFPQARVGESDAEYRQRIKEYNAELKRLARGAGE